MINPFVEKNPTKKIFAAGNSWHSGTTLRVEDS